MPPLCLLKSRGSLIIPQVVLLLQQLVLCPRQCFRGNPRVSLASHLTVGLAQKKMYALFNVAGRVCCLLRNYRRVCPLLTWMLWAVSSLHTPPWTFFFTPSMFFGHQEVLTITSFWFHTHPIEVAISAPKRAYNHLVWRFFPAWTFSAQLPSHW